MASIPDPLRNSDEAPLCACGCGGRVVKYQRRWNRFIYKHMPITAPDIRFWTKVDKSGGCWLWQAKTLKTGYGMFYDGTRITLAHRYAYGRFVGPLEQGQYVCHRCDNPRCVRPEHLFLGTPSENQWDCVAKGRRPTVQPPIRLGKPVHSKLTADDVRAIRARTDIGRVSLDSIGREYGVTGAAIQHVLTGRTWQRLL